MRTQGLENRKRMGKGELYFELIDLLGEQRAHRLMTAFPGIPVYIPAKAKKGHPIAKAIGEDGMETLCRHFQGETITVPKGEHLNQERRNADIYRRVEQGESPAEIAKRYNICYRTVLSIIARERERRSQLSLL